MTTVSESALTYPLYANKPVRRISGTDYVAVTMYRSSDGTVREYAVFSADGTATLGTAHYQPQTRTRPRRYTMVAVDQFSDESWPTLAAFATEMAKRLSVGVQ